MSKNAFLEKQKATQRAFFEAGLYGAVDSRSSI